MFWQHVNSFGNFEGGALLGGTLVEPPAIYMRNERGITVLLRREVSELAMIPYFLYIFVPSVLYTCV